MVINKLNIIKRCRVDLVLLNTASPPVTEGRDTEVLEEQLTERHNVEDHGHPPGKECEAKNTSVEGEKKELARKTAAQDCQEDPAYEPGQSG